MATDSIQPLVQIKPAKAAAPASTARKMELEKARAELSNARGPRYWRSLEELSGKEGFTEMLEREFPRHAGEWTDAVSRRNFLKLMSASLALAGLSACTRQPEETIVPYVQQPEELVPGKPMFFATARPSPLGAQPLLVESHLYRPTKVEGNPDHPMSMGAADVHSQASILGLYDPDRSQTITYLGDPQSWTTFLSKMREAISAQVFSKGAGFRILSETVTSPALASQINDVLHDYPQAKWYQYDPVNRDSARAGARMAFGQYVDAQYRLEGADVIVSLDADFLSGSQFPGFLKLTRDFAKQRKLDGAEMNRLYAEMSRFYVVESQMSTTGGKADHRLPMRAGEVEQFASALAAALGAGGGGEVKDAEAGKFMAALVKDLKANGGRSVVIPGEQQSPAVHALAAAMNVALGNIGKTVIYTDTVAANPTEQVAELQQLVTEMNTGSVNLLVILGGNPVYNAPADLNFAGALDKVELRVHLSGYKDETTRLCHWHVPQAHFLESWSDARACDGTVSIVQPLIEPLYGGKSAHEVVAAFSSVAGGAGHDAVKAYWKSQANAADFEAWWRQALHDGFIAGTAFPAKAVTAKPVSASATEKSNGIEIVFRPDPSVYDGSFANIGWLQELPKPVTKLTWDNAALMSLATAKKLGLTNESVAELELEGRKVQAPVLLVPGHPDHTVTVYLGFGRSNAGRVGDGVGFNAYPLRTSAAQHSASGLGLKAKSGEQWRLAITQHHHLIESELVRLPERLSTGMSETGFAAATRNLIRSATLEEFRKNPGFAVEGENAPPPSDLTLYPNWTEDPEKTSKHQWGMAIDMNSCVGCNACIVACQSENNIAVVGKEQVLMGREMHWLRIDTYFETMSSADVANPRAHFQPVPCMQCENAPCEPVCPVAATVHSPEGLNDMVYNRCVGTRYCSNNCPYKVRRFNFLLFSDWETESLKAMRNPDVTVRSRGVMEKCTYCVQRISSARIQAEKENRKIKDGEVVTACQQSCPADAIAFGDISDPNSRVSKLKRQERNYALLAEVNTRPRTTYIASVRNPNMDLEEHTQTENHGNHAG